MPCETTCHPASSLSPRCQLAPTVVGKANLTPPAEVLAENPRPEKGGGRAALCARVMSRELVNAGLPSRACPTDHNPGPR
jgi:hypothetical protein